VSLISDALGYDVNAPTLGAATRRLEVKTQGSNAAATVRFFLSRNEYEVGRRHTTSWALVMCCAPTGPSGAVEICGWCRADSLALYLPDDRNGRWTEAMVRMPTVALAAGFPPAV
jgi:hypothetical protein